MPSLIDIAARDPEGLALDDGARTRTWAELSDRTNRLARLMREDLGVPAHGHVAMLMRNRVEGVEVVHAALLAGLWITPINSHLARDEIAVIVEDSGAELVFSDEHLAETAREAGASNLLEAGPALDAALASASDAPMPLDGPAGGPMIYTSGTTGRPKGVKRQRAATLESGIRAGAAAGSSIGLDGSGPHLVTGPLYHAAPLMFAVYDQLNGAPIVIMPRWNDAEALAQIQAREIRHTHLVPTMFVRLLRLPDEVRDAFDAPHLDLVLHGAAPVATHVKRRMIAWWGEILVEYWGATEGGVTTLIDSAEWLAHPGSVGRALPHFEVFAVDDDGEPLPPGTVGQLYSRNLRPGTPFEYHRDPEKTAAAYIDDRVFTIGDIGFVDEEGFVTLADRKSHTIISGGVNIYPAEIEQVLLEHPAVSDVGVFGVPDDEWGESVKAAIEVAAGFDASPALAREILDFAREKLAGYKVPRSIDFERELPRKPTGKLLVRELRDRYWKGRERRI
jgi:long-chain acyl-CoA synthetase